MNRNTAVTDTTGRGCLVIMILFIFVGIPFVILVANNWGSLSKPKPAAEPKPLGAVAGVVDPIYTNTPRATNTQSPTKTAWPSMTAAEAAPEDPQVVYKEIVVVETVVVEVPQVYITEIVKMVTATPGPQTSTPGPTPNATETQRAFLTKNDNHKKSQWVALGWIGVFAAGYLVAMFLVLVTYNTIKKEVPKRPRIEDTTETMEEMRAKAASPVPGVTLEEFEKIKDMKSQGYNQTEIEEVISGMRGKSYAGGAIHRHVKKVWDYLDKTTPPPIPEIKMDMGYQA